MEIAELGCLARWTAVAVSILVISCCFMALGHVLHSLCFDFKSLRILWKDWEANFTKVTLCPVGGKPVPPGEASDEHADSGEPTGFFSSLFGW